MRRFCALLLCLLGVLVPVASAPAQTLSANFGNPTGPGSATSDYYFPYGYYTVWTNGNTGWGGGADLNNNRLPFGAALQAMGYNRTVASQYLNGSYYSLIAYLAWAENVPLVRVGNLTSNAGPKPGYGGTAIGLGFGPNLADPTLPTPDKLNWIQLINTNAPLEILPPRVRPIYSGSSIWFIDSFRSDVGDPFYNHNGGNATNLGFIDALAFPLSSDGYAYCFTFICWEPDPNTITIAEYGVAWGFYDPLVPGHPHPGHHHRAHLQDGDD